MRKRELQSKNAAGGRRGVHAAGGRRGGSRNGRKSRSISRGSLEEHVDPSEMYEYFME